MFDARKGDWRAMPSMCAPAPAARPSPRLSRSVRCTPVPSNEKRAGGGKTLMQLICFQTGRNVQRNGAALALVGDGLYAMGGFDGTTDCLSILERLDMSQSVPRGSWDLLPEMASARDGCCAERIPHSKAWNLLPGKAVLAHDSFSLPKS